MRHMPGNSKLLQVCRGRQGCAKADVPTINLQKPVLSSCAKAAAVGAPDTPGPDVPEYRHLRRSNARCFASWAEH